MLIPISDIAPNPLIQTVIQVNEEQEQPKTKTYTVKKNDTLEKIAKKYDTTWLRLFYKNEQIKHPDRLESGVELVIPEYDEELTERHYVIETPVIATPTQRAVRQAPVQSRSVSSAPAGYYDWGWCTYGAWQMTGWAGAWGDARFWDDNARRDGHTVSSTPIVGSIFVDNGGTYGHVGVVTAVNGSTITVRDMNYSGFGEWATRQTSASRFVYIYP